MADFEGFHKKLWQARITPRNGTPCLQLDYFSRDGEEGYPATFSVTVFYSLTDDNALKLEYIATTDADTVLNLTNILFQILPAREWAMSLVTS